MTLTTPVSISLSALGFALIAALACGESSRANSAAGSYKATSLVTTTAGAPRNELANGASINIVLAADSTTSGRVLTPATADNPALDADLAGTWSIADSTITFSHSADTFIRDMPFRFHGDSLVGDRTFSGTRVQVTLTRD